jgi:hypothetical protein
LNVGVRVIVSRLSQQECHNRRVMMVKKPGNQVKRLASLPAISYLSLLFS